MRLLYCDKCGFKIPEEELTAGTALAGGEGGPSLCAKCRAQQQPAAGARAPVASGTRAPAHVPKGRSSTPAGTERQTRTIRAAPPRAAGTTPATGAGGTPAVRSPAVPHPAGKTSGVLAAASILIFCVGAGLLFWALWGSAPPAAGVSSPQPVPPPAPQALPPPATQAQRDAADASLAEAKAFAAANPKDLRGYRERLTRLNAYASTPAGAEALALLDSIREPGSAFDLPTDAEWKQAQNLLPSIDPAHDAISGVWTKAADGLRCDGALLARLQIPGKVPEEYDFRITFSRAKSGHDVNQMQVKGGRPFMWSLGCAANSCCGFECIKGKDAATGECSVKLHSAILPGLKYTSIVQVRKGEIRGYLDGRLLCRWVTGGDDLSMRNEWKLKDASLLGVGSHEAATVFHTIELLDGKRLAKRVNLLARVDLARDTAGGKWETRDGALISDRAMSARLEIPYHPPEEYDFGITFTREKGDDTVTQGLAAGERQFAWCMGAVRNTVFGFTQVKDADIAQNPSIKRAAKCLETGRRYSSVVQVRKGGVKAFLDGELICEWKTDYTDMSVQRDWELRNKSVLGLGSWDSSVVFHSADLIEISGAGKPAR